jgi:predicted MPP superfamily phosphohydrolase
MPIVYLIVGAVGLGDLAWWRWADRRLRRQPRAARPLLRTLLALFIGSQFLYMAYFVVAPKSARRVHRWMPLPFVASAYLWHLLVLPASWAGIGVTSAASAASAAAERITTRRRPETSQPDLRHTLSRRQALTAVAAVATPPLLTALGVARAMPQLDHFRINPIHLLIPGLPPNLDGLRIAHLSDIHVGRYTRRGTLPAIVEATNQLRADLVLFTGDLIDLSLDDLDTGIAALRRLDPRHGLAIIEGNHDLIEDPDIFDRRMQLAGMPLLIDDTMTVTVRNERIQLLGMRWGAASGDRRRCKPADLAQSVAALQPQREAGAFPILLGHHPHCFDPAAAAGFPLTLSGHTHGGQLMLSNEIGFGPLFYRYWSGVYRQGISQLVVSNGVGNWFPLRINAPAEIIQLTLHRA